VASPRLKDVAAAMHIDVAGMTDEQGAKACIDAIRQLSRDVGIPAGLRDLNVKEEDFNTLATNALNDACALTNPIQGTHQDIVAIFKAAM